ncbi:hypothetical protein GCM10007338_08300 [Corynebacterium pelargi]|nr:hypothetical protein GCM10007338_08300 [Corynebacterium pelargi]
MTASSSHHPFTPGACHIQLIGLDRKGVTPGFFDQRGGHVERLLPHIGDPIDAKAQAPKTYMCNSIRPPTYLANGSHFMGYPQAGHMGIHSDGGKSQLLFRSRGSQ